jgi:transposase-like protein
MFTEPRFTNDDAAREHLESLRWPNGAVCPHCGGTERNSKIAAGPKPKKGQKRKGARPGLWFCGDCREQFTVTVGSVFERSKIPLHKWVLATHLLCASKKGMSSHQLHRMLKVTYKTAWFMSHRIREAFKMPMTEPLGGEGKVVEADETFWGNAKPINKRAPGRKGGGWGHKHKIFSLVERDGRARSFHVANVDHRTLKPILEAQIAQDTHLMTDSASHYRQLDGGFLSHEMVNHAAKEYARKVPGRVAHTNTVESFFGLFKRGLIGTYHRVSEAHLQRYCTEFDFRFSYRTAAGFTDEQRVDIALKRIGGKRLMYRDSLTLG